MGILRKRQPSHLIPVSPDNAASKDWVILLEAGTIVGPSPERLGRKGDAGEEDCKKIQPLSQSETLP